MDEKPIVSIGCARTQIDQAARRMICHKAMLKEIRAPPRASVNLIGRPYPHVDRYQLHYASRRPLQWIALMVGNRRLFEFGSPMDFDS